MPDSSITKNALAAAMKRLMGEKPFAKINVGDICELCQMNRKSFYYHFRDKYDLVNWIYHTEFITTIRTREYGDGWELLEDICVYFYKNRRFYVNALQVQGQNSFRDYFHDILKSIIQVYFGEMVTDKQDRAFFISFFTDAVILAIQNWLCDTPVREAGEFVRLLRLAMSGGAVNVRRGEERDELKRKQ